MAIGDTLTFQREKRAILLSASVGIVLLIIKFTAYLLTGSSAVFSDALEQIVNVLASGFAFYAILLAHLPADQKHPYGHGKVEFLSAGFEGALMLLASIMILWRAIEQIVHRPSIARLDLGLALVVLAMLVNGAVGMLLIRSGKKSGSLAVEADGWHLISDAITSAVVLGALILIHLTGWTYVDPITAMIVSVYIVFIALSLLRRSAEGLMDAQDDRDNVAITNLLDAHIGPASKPPHICSYHKLRHRHSGRYHWVDFHLMVPAQLSVEEGHQLASSIEYEIECMLGEGNATAHIEPCTDTNCPACPKR